MRRTSPTWAVAAGANGAPPSSPPRGGRGGSPPPRSPQRGGGGTPQRGGGWRGPPASPQRGSPGSPWRGPGGGDGRTDPLKNPLRAVLTTFACASCGLFDSDGRGDGEDGAFRCTRCRAGRGPAPERCAYASMIYGDAPQYVLGALALGYSLQASGTRHDRVLLHTCEVPAEARQLLQQFWRLAEVDYIISAPDLHTAPYDKARFKQVFTKLQVFNPEVLPYDRVVFLDVDTLVLRNVDDLFTLRPPAAMCNVKTRDGRARSPPKHGERLDPRACYFNAGTMVVAPSRTLFELLVADVEEPDPEWHRGAWSPEQNYLSGVLAGEWSHISQLYNLEVQLHSGVPLSRQWEAAEAADVAVAHFSGAGKVWDCMPERDVNVVGSHFVQQAFDRLTAQTRTSVEVRCRALHAEWHRALALALRQCHGAGLDSHLGAPWAAALHLGSRAGSGGASPPRPLLGEDVVFADDDGVEHLAQVVCSREGDGEAVVWQTPVPSAAQPFCPGPFGLCRSLRASEVLRLAPGADGETLGLGTEAVAWLGEGHLRGLVVASRGNERLLRFRALHAPCWFLLEELRNPASVGVEEEAVSGLSP